MSRRARAPAANGPAANSRPNPVVLRRHLCFKLAAMNDIASEKTLPDIGDEPGLAARIAAQHLLGAVLTERRAFDDAFAAEIASGALADASPRDRAFARLIVATALRHLGEIDHALAQLIETPLPKRARPVQNILRAAAAEMLFLGVKPHAAVDMGVEAAAHDDTAQHFKSLVNAVARRIAREGASLIAGLDAERLALPDWLWQSWTKAYGEAATRAIVRAQFAEPPLDLSVTREAETALWAERLGGQTLPTGTLRLERAGRIEQLPGFDEGAWWVQDAAAALPLRLLGEIEGEDVLDLCAAPGGKTAWLAARGAHVTALDRSRQRLVRLEDNLARLHLEATVIAADAALFSPARQWKKILLDAPCTATGTARRHPDVPHLKTTADRDRLVALQARLLDHAATLLGPEGTLVYCTCSLEPEEGPEQIERFLAAHPDFERRPAAPSELPGFRECLTPEGDVRTLPSHLSHEGGLDGFYAARLVRWH
jgi:16S rRNA (cytosine967-C5)-methyltransferase